MRARVIRALGGLTIIALVFSGTNAEAVDLVVDTTADGIDSAGNCSLREAVRAANLNATVDGCAAGEAGATDTILLGSVTYTLDVAGTGEDAALDGDLDVTENLAVVGVSAGSTAIGAAFNERVWHVHAGANLDLSKLAVSDGHDTGNGGAVLLATGAGLGANECRFVDSQAAEGGAIAGNGSSIALFRTWISGNEASGNGGAIHAVGGTLSLTDSAVISNEGARGGGIYARDAVVQLTRSEVADNTASFEGGGLRIGGDSDLTLKNVTVTGNRSINSGGGLLVAAGTDGLFANVTIAFNTANYNDPTGDNGGTGGGVYKSGSGTLTLRNTILAGNVDDGSGPDCDASLIVSDGHNLIQDMTSCELIPLASDLTAVDPLLGALANNGGVSETLALGVGSPARDAGNPAVPGSGGSACEFDDQRAIERPLGAACDIGAFEAEPPATPTPTDTATPTDPTATPTPLDSASPVDTATPSPTATGTSIPTPTPTPTITATPSPTTTPSATQPAATPTATPVIGCSTEPAPGCRVATVAHASTLTVLDAVRDPNDALGWTWAKGAITPKADFGDPLTTTAYDLCVYDGSATPVLQAHVAPGGLCGTKPCWKATRHGFAYTRKLGAPDGIDRLTLSEGLKAGKAKIVVRAKGTSLAVPPLPLTLAVRVQLQSSTGACWEATFPTATKNETRRFKARSE